MTITPFLIFFFVIIIIWFIKENSLKRILLSLVIISTGIFLFSILLIHKALLDDDSHCGEKKWKNLYYPYPPPYYHNIPIEEIDSTF